MDQAFILKLAGVILMAIALILHLISIGSTFHSQTDDLAEFGQEAVKFVEENPLMDGFEEPVVILDEKKAKAELISVFNCSEGIIHIGMWEFCSTAFIFADLECVGLSSEEDLDWIRAVQAMAIIGALLAIAALIVPFMNIICPSKGDLLKIFHIITLTLCIAAGVFMLIGDLIMASNHREAIDPALKHMTSWPYQIKEMLKDEFYLSWGFNINIAAVIFAFLSALLHYFSGTQLPCINGAGATK